MQNAVFSKQLTTCGGICGIQAESPRGRATSVEYRAYFGVPPKTTAPLELLDWAETIALQINAELERHTNLAPFHSRVKL